jgi:hypothetical protein
MTDSDHSLHCACVPPSEIHSEAEAETAAVEVAADADVQIAQIQADAAVTLAKIDAKVETEHDQTEVEALKAELKGMREMLDRLGGTGDSTTAGETEPAAPVQVVMDEPESAPESLPAVEAHHDAPDDARPVKKPSRGLGYW